MTFKRSYIEAVRKNTLGVSQRLLRRRLLVGRATDKSFTLFLAISPQRSRASKSEEQQQASQPASQQKSEKGMRAKKRI